MIVRNTRVHHGRGLRGSVLRSRSRSSPAHVGAVRCTQPSRCEEHVPGRRTSGPGVIDRVLDVLNVIVIIVVIII